MSQKYRGFLNSVRFRIRGTSAQRRRLSNRRLTLIRGNATPLGKLAVVEEQPASLGWGRKIVCVAFRSGS